MERGTDEAARAGWNGSRFRPGRRAGHYESWFLRANDATGRRALWIRYTIFSPRGRPEDAVGELWAIAFDRVGPHIVAVKETLPWSACRADPSRLAVQLGAATLDHQALRGAAASHGHRIEWDLRYGGGGPPVLLLPPRLYGAPLPRAKALVGEPLARFEGTLAIDGEPLVIEGWIGSQSHNWGSRHTDRYAWGQVAGFDEDPAAFLECSTARLRVGPLWTPWLSPVVLRLGRETLAWNALPRAVRARGSYSTARAPIEWSIETAGPAGDLALRLWAMPEWFVALRYGNPPGGDKRCLNSKLAHCELTLRRAGRAVTLRSQRAAFEILEDLAPGQTTAV
jgi:hypothetical protein